MPVDWKAHARRTIEALGADCPVTPAGSDPPFTVRGIFAAGNMTVLEEERAGVAVMHPTFKAMAEDVADLAVGDAIVCGGVAYTIAEKPQPEQPSDQVTMRLQLDE